MEIFFTNLITGLQLSSIFLLIALGLNITFGMMGVINFAHGEFLMIGAYTTYFVYRIIPGYSEGAWFLLAILVSFLVAGGIGFLIEKLLIRHLYGRPYESILATWGLSLILQQGARNIFGAQNVDIASPEFLSGGISMMGTQVPWARIFILGLSGLVLALMFFFMYRTKFGRKMQATMQNRGMAACMGIQVKKIDGITFAVGSGIAGIAGAVVTLLGSIGPITGQNYIVDSFMVVVLGGVGNLWGTLTGALMMGMVSPFFEYITTSSMGKVIVFALVVIFLQRRPQGLLVRKTRALD